MDIRETHSETFFVFKEISLKHAFILKPLLTRNKVETNIVIHIFGVNQILLTTHHTILPLGNRKTFLPIIFVISVAN